MGEIDTFKNRKFQELGEIDLRSALQIGGERLDFNDIWPGNRTDIKSLERNAAIFRQNERRRFFKRVASGIARLFKLFGGWLTRDK